MCLKNLKDITNLYFQILRTCLNASEKQMSRSRKDSKICLSQRNDYLTVNYILKIMNQPCRFQPAGSSIFFIKFGLLCITKTIKTSESYVPNAVSLTRFSSKKRSTKLLRLFGVE